MGLLQDGIRFAAGREDAAVIGVAGGQVTHNRVDDSLRHLRSAGSVEEDRRLGSCSAHTIQRRELLAKCIYIEHQAPLRLAASRCATAVSAVGSSHGCVSRGKQPRLTQPWHISARLRLAAKRKFYRPTSTPGVWPSR